MTNDEKMLSVKEVARRADVYEMTVYTAIREGRLQTTKTGRMHKISEEAFRDWDATRGRWPQKTALVGVEELCNI